jgi:AraC-like DNA-binding protein
VLVEPFAAGAIRLSVLAGLPELLDELGHDPAPILASVGLQQSWFADTDVRIAFATVGQLITHCIAVTHYSHIGLGLGARIRPSMLGIGGFIVQHATDVRTALEDLIHYLSLHDEGGVVTLASVGNTSLLGYSVYQDKVAEIGQIVFAALAAGNNIMQSLCGPQWRPREVLVTCPRPQEVSVYEGFFKAPVRFGATENALVFAADWLRVQPPRSDPLIYAYLKQQAGELRASRNFETARGLKPLLRILLLTQNCTMPEAARQLGMHSRTLGRRLRAEGTSFREEVASARCAMARQLLEQSVLPLAEVAEMLGYAELSAFAHAFKQWSAMTPGEWRQRYQVQSASSPPRA